MGSPPEGTTPQSSMPTRELVRGRWMAVLEDGVLAGIVGAAVVAIWFLILDAARDQIFFTPSLIGSVLFLDKTVNDVTHVNGLIVFAYTGLHGVLSLFAGVVVAFMVYEFEQNPQFSDDSGACMMWSEAIYVMVVTHAKWRTFTQRPYPPAGSCALMLSLALDSRDAVNAMNRAAAAHGGKADVNPVEDMGFMYTRDFADPDGHVWAALWMDLAATPQAGQN